MILIALVDTVFGTTRYVEFDAVPMVAHGGYQCIPAGTLARESANALACEVAHGESSGWIQGYRWHRQASLLRGQDHGFGLSESGFPASAF